MSEELTQDQKDCLAWAEGVRKKRQMEAAAAKRKIDEWLEGGTEFKVTLEREGFDLVSDPSTQTFEFPEGPPKVVHP